MTYEKASEQAINMQKSKIFFSRNTSQAMKDQITNLLVVTECLSTGKYLGLPSMIGRKKKEIFGFLRDRTWKRIKSWSGKHLSKAGREVLIKSVAQSIPTYCMTTFMNVASDKVGVNGQTAKSVRNIFSVIMNAHVTLGKLHPKDRRTRNPEVCRSESKQLRDLTSRGLVPGAEAKGT